MKGKAYDDIILSEFVNKIYSHERREAVHTTQTAAETVVLEARWLVAHALLNNDITVCACVCLRMCVVRSMGLVYFIVNIDKQYEI